MAAIDYVILSMLQQLQSGSGGVGSTLVAPFAPSNKYLPMDGRVVHRSDYPDYAAAIPATVKLGQAAVCLAPNMVAGVMLKASIGSWDWFLDKTYNIFWAQAQSGPNAYAWGSPNYVTGISLMTPGPPGAFGVISPTYGQVIISYDNGATLLTTVLPVAHTKLVWIDNPGMWVAHGGDYRSFSVSYDGVAWSHYTVNNAALTTGTFWGISYLNGTWCAIVNAVPYISTDMSTWTALSALPTNTAPNAGARILTVGGMAMAFADVAGSVYPMRSFDLKSWAYCKPPVTSVAVSTCYFLYQNGHFIISSTAAVYATVDGTGWTTSSGYTTLSNPAQIGYLNGLYYSASAYIFQVSADLVNWSSLPAQFASAMSFGGYTGTGSALIYSHDLGFSSSTDGSTWIQGAVFLRSGINLNLGNTYTLNGSLHITSTSWSGYLTTSDGVSWTARHALYIPFATDGTTTVGICCGNLGWSTDGGVTWTRGFTGSNILQWVAYNGAGVWVAVGAAGTILRSTDGRTWAAQTSGTSAALSKVVFQNGNFVAIGFQVMTTSTDGSTWNVRTTSITTQLNDVVWAAALSLWVVVAANSGTSTVISTSPDLVTWTSRQTAANAMASVVWANSLLIVVGANGTAYKSSNGTTWTALTGLSTSQLYRAVWSTTLGLWFIMSNTNTLFYTSPDATTWTSRNPWTYGSFTPMYGAASFTTSYGDVVMWSERGFLGVPTSATVYPAWHYLPSMTVTDMAAGSTTVVCVTSAGAIYQKASALAPWVQVATGLNALTQVIWTGSLFVAACSTGAIYTSPAGANGTWTQRTSNVTANIAGLATNGSGGVLGFTVAGDLIFSADGTTWSKVTLPAGAGVGGVCYLGGNFYALGSISGAPFMYRSPDGTTWTQVLFTGLTGSFTYVTTVAGNYVAFGMIGGSPKGIVSSDSTFTTYYVATVSNMDFRRTVSVGASATVLYGNFGAARFTIAQAASDVTLPVAASPISGMTYYIRVLS